MYALPFVSCVLQYQINFEFYIFDERALAKNKYKMVKREAKFKGLEAQVWQHELDHLNGINVWGLYGKEHTLEGMLENASKAKEEKPK